MKTLLLLTLALAGCSSKHYRVCMAVDDSSACRAGYDKHDAKVAAETLGSLPGIDKAWAEKNTHRNDDAAGTKAPSVVTQ